MGRVRRCARRARAWDGATVLLVIAGQDVHDRRYENHLAESSDTEGPWSRRQADSIVAEQQPASRRRRADPDRGGLRRQAPWTTMPKKSSSAPTTTAGSPAANIERISGPPPTVDRRGCRGRSDGEGRGEGARASSAPARARRCSPRGGRAPPPVARTVGDARISRRCGSRGGPHRPLARRPVITSSPLVRERFAHIHSWWLRQAGLGLIRLS